MENEIHTTEMESNEKLVGMVVSHTGTVVYGIAFKIAKADLSS